MGSEELKKTRVLSSQGITSLPLSPASLLISEQEEIRNIVEVTERSVPYGHKTNLTITLSPRRTKRNINSFHQIEILFLILKERKLEQKPRFSQHGVFITPFNKESGA